MPVHDNKPHTFILGDVLDISPRGDDSDINWDLNSWHGGDFNRLWFKSEGEHSFTEADRNIDVQVLYGRFVKKFYDLQVGGGVQTATFAGRNVTRAQAVLGVEAFVPFKSDLESLLFISLDGDVSGRVTFTRDFLVTQRLSLQPRIETNVAAQRVEEFTVGSGLNNLELGLRLRYEIRRQLAPYIGVSLDQSFFGTADLMRAEGKDPTRLRFVFGVRAWR
jgi:copper resistance protein B